MSPQRMRTKRKSTEAKGCNASRGKPAATLLMPWQGACPASASCTDYVPLAPWRGN